MTIEKISPADFWAQALRHKRETSAVRGLEADEALRFPCRWKHDHHNRDMCRFRSNVSAIGKKLGRTYHVTCHEKVVYVLREK
mgnify:FL=1